MQYGIWSSALAISFAITLPLLIWKLADIIRAFKGK